MTSPNGNEPALPQPTDNSPMLSNDVPKCKDCGKPYKHQPDTTVWLHVCKPLPDIIRVRTFSSATGYTSDDLDSSGLPNVPDDAIGIGYR